MDRSNSIRLERARKQYEHLLLNAGDITTSNDNGTVNGFPYGLPYHNSNYDNYSNYHSLKSSKVNRGLSSSGIHAAEVINIKLLL